MFARYRAAKLSPEYGPLGRYGAKVPQKPMNHANRKFFWNSEYSRGLKFILLGLVIATPLINLIVWIILIRMEYQEVRAKPAIASRKFLKTRF